MKLKTLLIVVALVGVTGCAVTKDYAATGGSKADGTVQLSYKANAFETVTPNEPQGLALAKQRCEAWGYKASEAFGGVQEQCESNGYTKQCVVTKEYQCLD